MCGQIVHKLFVIRQTNSWKLDLKLRLCESELSVTFKSAWTLPAFLSSGSTAEETWRSQSAAVKGGGREGFFLKTRQPCPHVEIMQQLYLISFETEHNNKSKSSCNCSFKRPQSTNVLKRCESLVSPRHNRVFQMDLLQRNMFLKCLFLWFNCPFLHTTVRVFVLWAERAREEEMVMLEGAKQHICD